MPLKNRIENDYFEWLYDYVCKDRIHDDTSYRELFMLLHEIEFTFSIRNDVNRYRDGIDLRYRFAMDEGDSRIADFLESPCSVLEMLIALAIRCEGIMDDPRYGDRTGQWFWNMLTNLGIGNMTDDRFEAKTTADAVYNFLDRKYTPDGRGGLFYIRGCADDLRDVEIWTQLCWYLAKIA